MPTVSELIAASRMLTVEAKVQLQSAAAALDERGREQLAHVLMTEPQVLLQIFALHVRRSEDPAELDEAGSVLAALQRHLTRMRESAETVDEQDTLTHFFDTAE